MSAVLAVIGDDAAGATRRAFRASVKLREQLIALAGGAGQVLAHKERAWASITFAGARHTLTLRFRGDRDVAIGEAMLSALPEHEFEIPGQLVVEASVVDVEHRSLPDPRLTATMELLLLEEA